MLSVNIPVFNFEVFELVKELVLQASQLNFTVEIRVFDDGSSEDIKLKNRNISYLPGVVYTELEKNLGRSAIRNKMGLESKFEYLLFIDADSSIVNPDYLRCFLANADPEIVLCGGTTYEKEPPANKNQYLRWFYGTHREAISAAERSNKKGFIITSNNFLVPKKVFEKIHFREDLKMYGHEDTLLGYDLHQQGVQIRHIENPVEHTGLEDGAVFLDKTRVALKSLHLITTQLLPGETEFARQVNFLNGYNSIRKVVPVFLLRWFFGLFHQLLEKHLTGRNPKLFWFDVYKLGYFATLGQKKAG
jgi:glycosyltransferase involved in cell wall biosynthesis